MNNEIDPKDFSFKEMIKTEEGIEVLSYIIGISIEEVIGIIQRLEK
jgi:hypothetical protein